MSLFGELDLGGLQRVLFPVIEALGGPDIQGFVTDKSEVLTEGADVLRAAADLMEMSAEAASDGIIETEEIEAIVAAAPSVGQAVDDLWQRIHGIDEEV
jgi:hypothetical protein